MAFIETLTQNPTILITWLLSIALNAMFILAAFVEPYKSVVQHAWKTWTHSKGDKLNALFFTKSGVMKFEYGEINSKGAFEYNEKEYAVNKKAFFNYLGMPTQIYKEGTVEPFDPYDRQEIRELSTNEAERIMMSTELSSILETIKRWAPIAGLGLLIMIGALGVLIYFDYQVFNEVVQKTGQAIQNTA